jgi:antitoxin HicB
MAALAHDMSIEREYEIVPQAEPEGGFSVFGLELPSVATQGETIEEATEMAKEAIEAYLEVMQEEASRSPPSTAAASPSTRREPQASGDQRQAGYRRPRKVGPLYQAGPWQPSRPPASRCS